MRKILCLAGLALVFMGGTAMADGRGGRDHRSGGGQHGSRSYNTQHNRGTHNDGARHVNRNVYQNNGHYRFDNGSSVRWRAPVSATRHRDHRVRPQPHYESYQNVAGYAWVPGSWQWDGYEWIWQPGYYARSGYSGYGY